MNAKRIKPGPGQESVWDYPRPPALDDCSQQIKVVFAGTVIANSNRAKRVLETSHPPTIYIPPEDVRIEYFHSNTNKSYCEWKGMARYYDIVIGEEIAKAAAWCYPAPNKKFAAIRNFLAFYPHMMEACFVDEEQIQSQAGGFYGGWITNNIVGPFKGEPGTMGW